MGPSIPKSPDILEVEELTIDHLDSLGQGVAKIYRDGKSLIYFIPKTLPGEVVSARVERKSQNLRFARVLEVIKPSTQRTTPSCQHFDNCQGCHYLHTSHEKEWEFKLHALKGDFKRHLGWDIEKRLTPLSSSQRTEYRNRIQLHYQLERQEENSRLGFWYQQTIRPIPHCQLPHPALQQKLSELYHDNQWLQLLPKGSPAKGHVELYLKTKSSTCELRWNRPYAEDGFSQVNASMNQQMLQSIQNLWKRYYPPNEKSLILDLFCGDGNLTAAVQKDYPIYGVDLHPGNNSSSQFSLNLFDLKPTQSFLRTHASKLRMANTWMMIDPPRSGFKHLKLWLDEVQPTYLLAISCHYATLMRDLKNAGLREDQLMEIFAFDMFPGTYHLEVMVLLQLRAQN